MLLPCQEKNKPFAYRFPANYASMELSLKEQEVLRDRLRSEMTRRGFEHQNAFAAFLGITPQFLGQILGGGRFGSRKLVQFAKRLNVPIGYLLGLEKLPDFFKDYLSVPVVEGGIAANPAGQISGEAIEFFLWIHRSQIKGLNNLVAVHLALDADSMEPTLHPGDLVVIDRDDRELTPRGLYAVRLPDLESCAVKRVQPVPDQQLVLLLSDNPQYLPQPVPWHEQLVIGRVVWSWTNWVR